MTPTDLDPSSHPVLTALFYASCAAYAATLLTSLVRPTWGRWVCTLGVALHLSMTVARGTIVEYFPLSNKMESFSAAALALGLVALVVWVPSRLFTTVMMGFALALLYWAQTFGLGLVYPVAPLITIWYPLHVPLSFLAYAAWTASAAVGALWFVSRDPALLRKIDLLALQGFGLWSLSMVFGGIWGVVAWGAYFLWDPKIIWSVLLWFHYASFIHVRLTPSLRTRPWVRPVLALCGLVWVFIAYIGTSFFFGGSSHAFQ
ncbi:MAG: hypothetical protein AUK47_19535 [Deltaproteobacteria bacterium CG2_30_63_29]|nr:MAG: hypothetical protein AUK47_19535 [Deltaproteobacteria bacterium CG2_30_63_29]PJB48556.1 MAG: hypothetical protein CO108_02170 [Deltaproteobacteria bacterium CG_4_9_14_3_um_filter_63_12]